MAKFFTEKWLKYMQNLLVVSMAGEELDDIRLMFSGVSIARDFVACTLR